MNDFKVGLFGIGLDTYWPQFEGLFDRLCRYQGEIAGKIASKGVKVVDAGMVDSISKADAAAELFIKEDVEVCFLFISTYALSATVLPVAQRVKKPVIILNLQPAAAIDYDALNSMGDRGAMTGEWLAYCQACPVPEIASVFNRAKLPYHIVSGFLQDGQAWADIFEWVDAAKTVRAMRMARIGILGNYYNGMLDLYSDVTLQSIVFGTRADLIEMCELFELRQRVTSEETVAKLAEFEDKFKVSPECPAEELERAARTSVALDKLVEKHGLDSLAYYYEGQDGNGYEDVVTSVIAGNTLLTGKGIPVAGECDVKNVQAMKIMSLLGAGGSFSEFYSMDFNDDVVLLGHDGPAHFAIAEGEVGLVPLSVYHGKPGKGLSIQMSVKQGDVTLLSVCHGPEGISLLAAEGKSVAGPILQTGNTNSRYKFGLGVREFVERWSKAGPSHHCAIGVGHVAGKIRKVAGLIGIPFEQIV